MKLSVYYVIALVLILFDQWTKYLVVIHMEIGESIELIKNVLYFTSHRNQGAAFGILQGQMWLFYIITVIVTVVIIYYLQKYGKESVWIALPLAFILGGAIGNFIDRLFRGSVVDFVDVYIGTYNYPIFNVADSALVVGVAILMIKILADERHEKRRKAAS